MTADVLLGEFDRICEAPDAIPHLRRFILDLAVRGKLVPQDSSDEPATELLKRIAAERHRRTNVREGIKSDASEAADLAAAPFSLPPGWEVARMGWLASKLGAGSTPLGGKSVYQTDGVPFIRSQNVYNDGLRLDDVARISRTIHDKMSGTHVKHNDILLNITGASIGRSSLVPESLDEGNVSQHVAIIRLFEPAIRHFIHLSLTSPLYQKAIDDAEVGVSREGLSMQRLRQFPMVLPPLAEQHRIVAKVDELMALCDQLEAARNAREENRDKLVAASLQRLGQPVGDAAGDRDHARFTLDHLAPLTTRPEHIKQLRQAILNLAVRGKLVPQDPRDEPAKELVKRIKAESGHLDGNDAPKGSRHASEVDTVDTPFTIPESWYWTRVQDTFEVRGGIQKTPTRAPAKNAFPYLGVGNVYRGRLNLADVKRFELYEGELDKYRLIGGDILVVEGNGSASEVGRCAVWSDEIENCVHQNHIIRCRPVQPDLSPFVLKYLNSMYGVESMKAISVTSSGLYNLSVGRIRTLVIPLPPLAEQHRIVAKIDELMALCDHLEAQLITTETESRRLLEAALHEALGQAV